MKSGKKGGEVFFKNGALKKRGKFNKKGGCVISFICFEYKADIAIAILYY